MAIKLQPEIKEGKYWIHLALVTLILLIILKFVFNHDMLSVNLFWKVGISLAVADITIHTILKLK